LICVLLFGTVVLGATVGIIFGIVDVSVGVVVGIVIVCAVVDIGAVAIRSCKFSLGRPSFSITFVSKSNKTPQKLVDFLIFKVVSTRVK